ncbi:MAG: FAD/NAD(P)-binding oxidoreductase [bacterium]|nr:FAD/NAD(P)-binding oxidoreductase [bacterium]
MTAEFDYLIIGGGIAGTTVAESIREKDQLARIAILNAEPHPLYSKVLIPSYLKGRIDRDKLFLRKISHYNALRIDFFPNTMVASVDAARHEITTDDKKVFSYKKLLVASGGRPVEITEAFSSTAPIDPLRMHTIEDADKIKNIIETAEEKKVLVVGEGFIALEFLEIFTLAGFEVHASARTNEWGAEKFGSEGSKIIEENFRKHNIVTHHTAAVSFIRNDEFYLANGDHFKCPYLAAGIGLKRDLSFLSGLSVNKGVIADEYLRTSNPDIYAAGDIAEYYDVRNNDRRVSGNWTGAFLQGRTAAANMLGGNTIFNAVQGYNLVSMGLNISLVGDTQAEADNVFEFSRASSLVRILIKGGKIAGGVLINRFDDKVTLQKLIEEGKLPNDLEKIFS